MIRSFSKSLIAVMVLIFIGVSASCLKKQNLESEDLGAEVSSDQIYEALSSGFGEIDYSDISVNEFSSIIQTQRVQDGAPQTLEQQDVTIQNVANTSSSLTLDVLSTKTTYNGNQSSQSTRIWNKTFKKYSGFAFALENSISQSEVDALSSADSGEPVFMFQLFQSLALGSCYTDGNYPETCHNLSVSDVRYQVPSTAAHQHNCGNIFQCFIDAKKIEFDLVRKYEIDSDGKPKRIHFTLILSREVPFTSRVLKYCSRTLYEISGAPQKILADLCYDVNNYTFGN